MQIVKELTAADRERFAARAKNPQTAAMIRSGHALERITDFDGTVYARPDILTRDFGGGLVTKAAAPTPAPASTYAPRPVQPATQPAARAAGDCSELLAEWRKEAGLETELPGFDEASYFKQLDAAPAIVQRTAELVRAKAAASTHAKHDDLADLVASVFGGGAQ